MKNFALIGAAGFVAPRHLKAIKETGNNLVAALDKHDNVGILDSYFPDADFFTEFERFDRHLDKLKRKGEKVDYISICSPNYLHDSHIRFALRSGANAICEKPLVLNPWNVDALAEIERETGKKVYTILQLRLHPSIIALRERIRNGPKDKVYDIDLQYMTSRGHWYHSSWKGDIAKSGGIATNIGVHFFDMLMWIFGNVKDQSVESQSADHASGYLHLDQANVKWFLSINYDHIPEAVKKSGKRTFRSLKMEGEEIEFSDGFTDLHTRSYEEILNGKGFGLEEARDSIGIVKQIRAV
ncbi:MAG TPA: Gfo/Idh/MocA family oxidoreductase [Ohtaekwangia sp.]|nr:Gfo/Idh/MocA family oxidoreductase [Ohtaekwangia sp.]